MSRSTMSTKELEEYKEHDDNIKSVLTDFSVKEDKVVIADFDSLIWFASYQPSTDENGSPTEYYTLENGGYEIAEGILSDKILSILSEIEKYFTIKNFYVCVKGKNNFRYEIYKDYKSKRSPSPPIINHLHKFLIDNYQAITAVNCESDDVVFSISEAIHHKGIILTVDKDLKQINSIIYDYQKNIWCKVSEEDAMYNFAIQMLIGDACDGINFTPNFGIKKAEKLIQKDMSKFQYLRKIYYLYKQIHKEKAKEMIELSYKLLKLHNINNLPIT